MNQPDFEKDKNKIEAAGRWAGEIVQVSEKITEKITPDFKELNKEQIPHILELICAGICREYGIEVLEISLSKFNKRMDRVRKANQSLINKNRKL